jgi:two-component system OmpR family sensor kinase
LSGRTPLRVKLISAVLALVAVALVTTSVVGILLLRSYLLGQANQQLSDLAQSSSDAITQHVFTGQTFLSAESAIDWVPGGGRLEQVSRPVAGEFDRRVIPGPLITPRASWLSTGLPTTVPATTGGGRWRVLAFQPRQPFMSLAGPVTGTVIVAVDVSDAYATIGRLTLVDVIVTAVVLLAIAAIGITVVRASLRSLTEIERTAGAIAAGDLTRRVRDQDPRTEVGRLGQALNAMLAQIETAFEARAASELAARRSENRMRQFVADASHELRTPLTAIRGFAEYYRQRGGLDLTQAAEPAESGSPEEAAMPAGSSPAAPGPPARESNGHRGSLRPADMNRIMRRVEQESARMGMLVEDMLLLARLDQQRPLERRTVDLLALAADAVHDARVVAPDRGIDLTVGAGAALLVLGDETRLRQVIGNLMSNALVHTPPGTPIEVRIRSGSLDEGPAVPAGPRSAAVPAGPRSAAVPAGPRSAAVLEVADQGPGLTPEQAEHAFERFYRADKARTPGGTGLGLSIVAALVAAHGGKVWVESPPAGGATFRIALPLAPEAVPPEALAPEAVGPAAGPAPDGDPGAS